MAKHRGKKQNRVKQEDTVPKSVEKPSHSKHIETKWRTSYIIVPLLAVFSGPVIFQLNNCQIFRNFYENYFHVPESSQNGGWRLPDANTLNTFHISTCDVDRLYADEITSEQFRDIYQYKKPLIIKFHNGASGWTDPSKWTVNSLRSSYGKWSIVYGNSRDIVRQGGSGDIDTSFSRFLDKMMGNDSDSEPQYLFDRDFYNSSGLPQTLHPPEYLAIKDSLDDSIFFLGASGSGVSFHQHADAWNGVVYGRKRWFLYPIEHTPPGGVYPGFTQLEWYHTIYPHLPPHLRPMECVQEAGEILYLPECIYHGTINIGDTIAVGIQKKISVTPVGKLFYEFGDLMKEPQSTAVKTRIKEVFMEMLKLLPENQEAMMKLGAANNELEDYMLARSHLQTAVESDPHFILAWLELAKVHEKLGDTAAAQRCFEKAGNQSSSLWEIFAFHGDFLLRQGQPEEAAAVYKQGLLIKPRMINFWRMLKLAQDQMGDVRGAEYSQEWIDLLS